MVVAGAVVSSVSGDVKSPHYMSVGCHTYAHPDGQLERCQGLYTLERSWDEAVARCQSDGWDGLAMADTKEVETTLGEFVVWMNEELDADNGYSAWIGGHEVEDRVWRWTDGTAFKRQFNHDYLHKNKYLCIYYIYYLLFIIYFIYLFICLFVCLLIYLLIYVLIHSFD